jgi:hypothetical protein
MSAEAVVSISLSRPKIHRLPAATPTHHTYIHRFKGRVRSIISRRVLFMTSGALVSMVVLAVLLNGFVSMLAYHINALPQFASVSGANASLLQGFGDAMASPSASSAKQGKTIIITSDNGSIVGQMAQIPDRMETPGNIKTMSDIDKNTGRELLSIVDKY